MKKQPPACERFSMSVKLLVIEVLPFCADNGTHILVKNDTEVSARDKERYGVSC